MRAPYRIGNVIYSSGKIFVPSVLTTAVPKMKGAAKREIKSITTANAGWMKFEEMIEPRRTPPSFAPIISWKSITKPIKIIKLKGNPVFITFNISIFLAIVNKMYELHTFET
jgi:hypothetical protein